MQIINSVENFQVYVRIRPTNDQNTYIRTNNQEIFVGSNTYQKKQKKYQFTEVFSDSQNNEYLWQNSIKKQLSICQQGYNLTLFAYGVTGSGKTHTIFGNQIQQGLAIKCFKELIKNNKNCEFKFSYLQIYNQCVKDLLSDNQKNLNVMEENNKTQIPELKQFTVFQQQQIKQLINIGNQKRSLAANNINQLSSRSHAILQFTITKKQLNQIITSKLTIIDLAGSQKTFYNQSNKMILQGSNINKSLLALGNCIKALSNNNSKNIFIPYRDSKLTRILKQTLSGNSRSIMIACISPNPLQYDQTLNTIYYACRAYKIKKNIRKNVVKGERICCPKCKNEIQISRKDRIFENNLDELQNKLREGILQNLRSIQIVDIQQFKSKLNQILQQSELIGKRSQLNYIYDSSILKQVFSINKTQLHKQIQKIQNCYQILNNYKNTPYSDANKENQSVQVTQKTLQSQSKLNNSIRSFRLSQKSRMDDQKTTKRKDNEITLRMKRDLDETIISSCGSSKKQLIRKKIEGAKQYINQKNIRIF